MEIPEDMLKDNRLRPLSEAESIVQLCLFVLQFTDKNKSQTDNKILYGWCVLSPKMKPDTAFHCSSPVSIFGDENCLYSISKVTFYNTFSKICDIVNDLLRSTTLIEISKKYTIGHDKLKFDIQFASKNQEFSIRPIIFNEPVSTVDRHFFEKSTLYSPFKEVPSFTLIINRHDKIGLFQSSDNTMYPSWKEALQNILKYMTDETTMPFSTSGSARLGNIEFINSQACDLFGSPYAYNKNKKEEVIVGHKTVSTAKEIIVNIEPNPFTENRKLIVNCYISNGSQIILDECKYVFHKEGEILKINFTSHEDITAIATTVWRKDGEEYQIWFKNSGTYIRNLSINMGVISQQGIIKSDWIENLGRNNRKLIEKTNKASEISKASYRNVSIGAHELDPWVTVDESFNKILKKIFPEKSEAEFFPKGWDSYNEEQGLLSFLGWFKNVTDKAQKVVLLDPFFDTLGLEFLTKTTNSGTSFNIITCSQIQSLDDDKKNYSYFKKTMIKLGYYKNTQLKEPNRATRVKHFINSHPSLFNGLQLNIYDLRNSNKEKVINKNIIHDRYILIFGEETSLLKGFHLSNSIQGATQNHPLLITPIPRDILDKINIYLDSLLMSNSTIDVIELYKSENKMLSVTKKDTSDLNLLLLQKLNNAVVEGQHGKIFDVSQFDIKNFVTAFSDKKKFTKDWATFGYFLANIPVGSTTIFNTIKPLSNQLLIENLVAFIKSGLDDNFIYGFSKEIMAVRANHLYNFKKDFKTCFNLMSSYYYDVESCYGSWGINYALTLLMDLSIEEYLGLGNYFIEEGKKLGDNTDTSNKSITKLVNLYTEKLLRSLNFYRELDFIDHLLKSNIDFLKSKAITVLIQRNNVGNEYFDAIRNRIFTHFTTDEQLQILCSWLLYSNRSGLEDKIASDILSLIEIFLKDNFSDDNVNYIVKTLTKANYPDIEKKITENILMKVFEVDLINGDYIFNIWSNEFVNYINNPDEFYRSDFSGLIDITGWAYCTSSVPLRNIFIKKIEKQLKSCKSEIFTQFHRDTNAWNVSFEKLLLIKSVLKVIALYNIKNISKIDDTLIIEWIKEIKQLIENYNPRHLSNQFVVYENQLALELV